MINDETDIGIIRIMKPRHAYIVAKKLNDVYAFFTDENLENDPNKTLEILSEYNKRPKRLTLLELEYQKTFDGVILEASKDGVIAKIIEDIDYLNKQIEHESKKYLKGLFRH